MKILVTPSRPILERMSISIRAKVKVKVNVKAKKPQTQLNVFEVFCFNTIFYSNKISIIKSKPFGDDIRFFDKSRGKTKIIISLYFVLMC